MVKQKKFQLKFNNVKNLWIFKGDGQNCSFTNYYQALDKALRHVRVQKGLLDVYKPDGSIKEHISYVE